MGKVYVNKNDICKINTNSKNKKCEEKNYKETVLMDKVYDKVNTVVTENIPRCVEFEIKGECELPFNSKVEILETTVITKVKKLNNKIFIQGHEIDSDHEVHHHECNKITLDDSLINICKSKKYPKFALKVNEWVEICVEIEICIKAVAYVDDCDDEICFEAVGCFEDEICVPLMYTICVPNFIEDCEKPYLEQCNFVEALVDQSFIFLSPLPDCYCNIEKLLGKLVITYCVSSNMKSIAPNYIDKNKKNNKNNKKRWTSCDNIIIVNNKRA